MVAGLARHGSKIISFQVVRRMARRTPTHVALWRAHLRKERTELCVFLRLKESNKVVQDYAVVSPEIAIELRNLDELGTLVGHYILLETPQVPHSVNADRS